MSNQPIGIFDSGLGGLTVLKQVKALMPHENIIYYGDIARAPYGSKSIEMLKKISEQIVRFLLTEDAKAIVIACNTVSSVGLENLKEKFSDIPVLDIIQPMVLSLPWIIEPEQVLLVIGTEVTISSGVYERQLNKYLPNVKIISQACPLFVELIEEGSIYDRFPDSVIRQYLDEIIRVEQPDYLVLGCTHYPLISHRIQKLYPHIKLLDPAFSQAQALQNILRKKNLEANSKQKVQYKFYASELSDVFQMTVDSIMDKEKETFTLQEMKF